MRNLSAVFGLLMLTTVCGCADAPGPASDQSARGEHTATGRTTSQALTVDGLISPDGLGDALKGLAGKDVLAQATEVVASKLGDGGKLIEIAKTAVADGGKFDLKLPNDGGPLGIVLLQAKNVAGVVVGTSIINTAPGLSKAELQATIDTVTSVKSEIVTALAKNEVPNLQNVLTVVNTLVDAQLADAMASAGGAAVDLDTVFATVAQAAVAAEGAMVASLQGAGLPIDLSAVTNAQLSTIAGAQEIAMTATGQVAGNTANLVAFLKEGLSKATAPTDPGIFNAIVAGSAMFNSVLKGALPVKTGGGFGGTDDLVFSAFKSTFKLQTDLMTAEVEKLFGQAGTGTAATDALKKASADLLTQIDQAKDFSALTEAKKNFDDALSGKQAGLGVLDALTGGLASAIMGMATSMDPLAQKLAATLGGTNLTNASIQDAIAKFDDGSKDLVGQLTQLTTPADAQAILDALKTSAKVFVP